MKIVRPIAVTAAILVSDVPENDYAAYNVATTYAIANRVISTTTHRIYESLQNANTGNALPVSPALSTAWWLDVGATNRWKMFDGGVNTQTAQATGISVTLTPGRIDSVALLNINASTYRCILAADAGSPTDTVYDSGTVSVEQAAIGDWYQYFYEAIIQITDVVLTNLPPYTDGVLTVILSAPGGTAKIGMLVVGLYRSLGDIQWRPRVGIVDYSVKSTDSFGNVTVTQRAFSKRLTADVFVDNELIDEVIRLLAEYRATPVVWVGTADFTSTILYGFFKAFDAVIDSPGGSFCNLEVEGLT